MEHASREAGGDLVVAQILGPFHIHNGAEILRPPSRQAARVAAILVLHRGSVVPREYLIQQLWQQKPPVTAANALQVHISKVRKLFAPHGVELESNGYRLEPVPTDGDHVRVSLAQATEFMVEGDFLRAAATAHRALDQWRGEPYDGLEGPEVRAQRALFAEVRAQLAQTHLEARIELAISPIHINEVVAESAGFVARYPQRPAAHELFRHALRKAGRFEEAAAHFEGMIPHDGDPSPLVRG